jgi:ABC-type bacteriocin/lantibiotic exporter with double-glycine peptidase domain
MTMQRERTRVSTTKWLWDLAALRRRYSLSLRGTTLHDLVRMASSMRLSTRALRAELPHLRRLRLPCILHCDHALAVAACDHARQANPHSAVSVCRISGVLRRIITEACSYDIGRAAHDIWTG